MEVKKGIKFLYRGTEVSVVFGRISGIDQQGQQQTCCFFSRNDSGDLESAAKIAEGGIRERPSGENQIKNENKVQDREWFCTLLLVLFVNKSNVDQKQKILRDFLPEYSRI